ncbi:MAG: hypothetical protein L0Z54_04565 [Thermoplasmata archaeon]|nr:hypothetical protein [Thermoplasmata archaeon]
MDLACEIREKGLTATFDRRWPDAFLLGTHGYFLMVAALLGRVDLFAFGVAAAVGSWGMFAWVRSG